MKKRLITLFILGLVCNQSFCQNDDAYAGVSYSITPASHPVFSSDKEFERTRIASEEFNCFVNYGDTLRKNAFWFTSLNYSLIKTTHKLNDSTLSLLKPETPAIFTRLPQEQFLGLSAGLLFNIKRKYNLVHLNSITLTDIVDGSKHTGSLSLDGIFYTSRILKKNNSIGLGCYYNTNLKKITAFPVFTSRFNLKKWELSASLPLEFKANYKLSRKFSLGASSNLRMYYFDVAEKSNEEQSYILHTLFKLAANAEYKFKFVTLFSGVGIAYQEFTYNSTQKHKFTLPESPFLEIGLKLTDG